MASGVRPLYVKAGDTFFTRSNTLLGKLIRWGETDPGETNGTWTNHTGVVVQEGWIGNPDASGSGAYYQEAVVIEALWKTRKGPLKVNGVEVRVFRPVPAYTPTELERFRAEAERYVGATYGWWKLLFQLADRAAFKGRKVLTTALYLDKRPICSYLAGKVNASAESLERSVARLRTLKDPTVAAYAFGIPPQSADPDEMMDFCLAHPELWQEVR